MPKELSTEPVTVIHPKVSHHCKHWLHRWAKELDLKKMNGRRLSMNQLATIILEDFADEYKENYKLSRGTMKIE